MSKLFRTFDEVTDYMWNKGYEVKVVTIDARGCNNPYAKKAGKTMHLQIKPTEDGEWEIMVELELKDGISV